MALGQPRVGTGRRQEGEALPSTAAAPADTRCIDERAVRPGERPGRRRRGSARQVAVSTAVAAAMALAALAAATATGAVRGGDTRGAGDSRGAGDGGRLRRSIVTREFAPPGQAPRYLADRLYHLHHVRLDLAFDLRRRSVAGTATNILSPLLPGLDHLVFHAAELHVARVRLSGEARDLAFTADAATQTLKVQLPRAYGPADRLEVVIEYSAQPRAGMYVQAPDRAYPGRAWQLFTDGEPEHNRYWFPSWDEPDDRATSEIYATVERPLEAIGNGRLVEVAERADGRRTYHWSMEQPHSTYLIALVVGQFSRTLDSWHGVPVESYVPPPLADRAARAFGSTVDMMELFSDLTGKPYPYAKYSQAAVYGFMWEGMENISATTMTTDTLRDARAALDGDSDDLVSHELAHQWFGDLITCRGWEHAWLNEGMATYFEALYQQHRAGGAGDDELEWKLDESRVNYLEEDRDHYRRPLVTTRYVDPIRMFDSHTYDKGALVVQMIRYLVGEEGWRRGLRLYVERHALGTVTSQDLERAFEDASGVDLAPLFDQFVYGAGYPEIQVRWEYQEAAHRVHLTLHQTQKVEGDTGLFSFPLEVALLGEAAQAPRRERVAMAAAAEQDLYIASPTRPRTVVFDPHGALLKVLDFDKPAAEWILQLQADLPLAAKLDAARALATPGDDEAVAALGQVLVGGGADGSRQLAAGAGGSRQLAAGSYGLRQLAAGALAQIGSGPALAALERGIRDPDARVRAAVFAALGAFPNHAELIAPLRQGLEGDASYGARAAAALALGRFAEHREEVTPILLRALRQASFLEEVPRAAIRALGDLGAPETLPQGLRLARYGSPEAGRADAMLALGTYAAQIPDLAKRRDIRRALEGFLDDPDFNTRAKVPEALAALGDPAAIPALQRSLAAEVQDEQRHRREEAIHQLQTPQAADPRSQAAKTPSADAAAAAERIQQLERANDILQERLHDLLGQPAAPTDGAPPP